MVESQSQLTDQEIAQVEEHKYFLSEKAGYDVGWEHAEQDWREQFGRTESASDVNSAVECGVIEDGDKEAKGLGGLFRRFFSKAAM